ncbi:MAG: glutathione S-transferase family protein [Hyphomonadaceae bacterium]|nr:glutathione S-transferase family protein [Hyphomonadaceae bacterium]
MLTIYHVKPTRSLRVVWLAEELGLPYSLKHMPFDPAALRTEEFLRISPFGIVPAIEDGGVRMTESGAICQYLTERYGKAPFRRQLGDPDYPQYLQWLHAGEATLTPPLTSVAAHTVLRPEPRRIPLVAEEAAERFREHAQVLNRQLGETGYLLGSDFTAVDVMVGYALHVAKLLGLLKDAPDDVRKYFTRLAERPAYQRAVAA